MFVKALLNRWKVCLTARLFLQVGLDAAGKTTILYKLKLGEIVTTIPTIGKLLNPRESRWVPQFFACLGSFQAHLLP